MIKVSVVGATGYTGAELVDILLRHRHVEVRHVASESSAGKRLADVLPFLRKRTELVLEKIKILAMNVKNVMELAL